MLDKEGWQPLLPPLAMYLAHPAYSIMSRKTGYLNIKNNMIDIGLKVGLNPAGRRSPKGAFPTPRRFGRW